MKNAHLIRHGLTRYRKGCKCDTCRAANAKRSREWWANRHTCATPGCGERLRRRSAERVCGFCQAELQELLAA